MFRKPFAAAALVAALAAAGCGGSTTDSTPSGDSKSKPAKTVQSFRNMTTLAADLETTVKKRIADQDSEYYDPTFVVKGVTCIAVTATKARCLLETTDPADNESTDVTIASDGQSYLTD